jgi:hypothetical protein
MTRGRVLGLIGAGVVIAVVACAVFLPYVNGLVYPQLLSKAGPFHTATSADWPDPRIGRIDELGAADHIHSEADARAYVDALIEQWGRNEKELPGAAQLVDRLARAEYAAIREPQKRIPESLVAKTFNGLMNEWQMPSWTRISVEELHAFRIVESSLYSRSVARLPDGSIAPDCRPTEALLLLDQLNFNGGVQPWVRERVRARHFPWNLLKRFEWRRPIQQRPSQPVEYHLAPLPANPLSRQMDKYDAAKRNYFASFPGFDFSQFCYGLFVQLGIN